MGLSQFFQPGAEDSIITEIRRTYVSIDPTKRKNIVDVNHPGLYRYLQCILLATGKRNRSNVICILNMHTISTRKYITGGSNKEQHYDRIQECHGNLQTPG
jgi:hypothetical protein